MFGQGPKPEQPEISDQIPGILKKDADNIIRLQKLFNIDISHLTGGTKIRFGTDASELDVDLLREAWYKYESMSGEYAFEGSKNPIYIKNRAVKFMGRRIVDIILSG